MGKRDAARGRISPLAVIGWVGAAALLGGALLAALGGLNQSVYGASNFVQRYLSAIADDDLATAATTPGVALNADALAELGLPTDVSTAMLRSGIVDSGPADVRIVEDVQHDDGTHSVTASYRIGTSIAETTFEVKPIEPLYGVLHRWAFAESPLAIIDVTAAHSPQFTVGDLTLDTRATKPEDELENFTQTTPYLAIAPAAYEFEYDSQLLQAPHVTAVAAPGKRGAVTVDAQPTQAFVDRVQAQLDLYLQGCVEQQVLNPTDCPFGIDIDDRILSAPVWSMVASPTVTLTAGESAFEMPATAGTAHISVEVQSLFDGEVSTLEEDRGFTVALDARIKPDGSIAVQLK